MDRLEAAYDSRVQALNNLGILESSRLPLPAAVTLRGVRCTSWPVVPFGLLAGRLRKDDSLRCQLAELEPGADGMLLISPDLGAGFLQHIIDLTRARLSIFCSFEVNGDLTGDLVPIPPALPRQYFSLEPSSEVIALRQPIWDLFSSGVCGSNGYLGVSFMDAGVKVPERTREMDTKQAMKHCATKGLRPAHPKNYVVAQALAGDLKLDADPECKTYLDGFSVLHNSVIDGHFSPRHQTLTLGTNDNSGQFYGVRREARVIF